MKVYKIGDVSKICEISAASIRFFEEKGILHPQKDTVNNYRYYTVWDINRLLEYRKLRELGFSLNESIDIITGSGLQQFRKSLDTKIEEAEKLAAYYEMKAVKLRNYNAALQRAQLMVDSYKIVSSPAYYYFINRIFDGEDYTFIKSEETDGAIELMMENYEFSENIYRIERDWFEGDCLLPKYQWGLAIKQMWSNSLHLSIPDNMTYAPSVKSIYTIIRTTGRNAFSPELFLPAMEYLKQAGYELAGDVMGIWIATIQEEGQEARYMEVWIPIKE